jgi:hypothetical protein
MKTATMIAARTATIHGNGLAAVGEAFGAEVVAEVTSFSRNLHVFLLSFGLDPDRALVAEHNRPSGQFVQRASPIRQPNAKASYTYPGIWHNEFFNTKHALQCRAESIAVSSNVKDFEFGGNWVRPGGSSMHAGEKHLTARERPLVRFGLGLANWSERWFPDPLIFALAGIVIVFVVGLLLHQSPAKLAIQGGKSFWALVPFTMQMDDHHRRICRGFDTDRISRHTRLGWNSQDTARSGRRDRLVLDVDVAYFLGLESDFQWPLGLRACAPGQRIGLPRGWRRRLSRAGSGLGDGSVFLGRHADGDQVGDATFVVQH